MPALTIKGIPEPLYERLKQSASENRRSINSEVLVCLERSLGASRVTREEIWGSADALRRRHPDLWVTEEEVNRLKEEGRS